MLQICDGYDRLKARGGDTVTTGERIRARRKALGISADVLADTLKVSRSTIFRYENGDIEKLPIDRLEPISKILHTSPAYLMGWTEDNKIPATISDDGPVDKWAELIQLLQQVPEEQQDMLYNMIEAALKSHGLLK